MKHFNYFYEDFQDEKLNLTDRVILSIISSFNEYTVDYQELNELIGITISNIKLSIKKLKKLNLVQGNDKLELTNKTQGRYFRVDIEAGLDIKQLLVKNYIISLPDKAFYGSIDTLCSIFSFSRPTVISLLQTMTEKDTLIKVKQGKTFNYTVNITTTTNESKDEVITTQKEEEITTDDNEEQIIEETPIEEEMNEEMNDNTSVDIEALKAENEALKTRIENAIVEYRKLKDEYYKVEYQRQLLEAENQKLKLNQNKQTKTNGNKNTPYPLTETVLEALKHYSKYFFCKCIYTDKWSGYGGDVQDLYNYLNKLTPTVEDNIQVDLELYRDSVDEVKYHFMNLKYILSNVLVDDNNVQYREGLQSYFSKIYERNKN